MNRVCIAKNKGSNTDYVSSLVEVEECIVNGLEILSNIFCIASRALIQPISADIGNDLIYMDIRRPSLYSA